MAFECVQKNTDELHLILLVLNLLLENRGEKQISSKALLIYVCFQTLIQQVFLIAIPLTYKHVILIYKINLLANLITY